MMIGNKPPSMELYEAIASLNSAEEVQALLVDLCTPQELMALSQRFAVAGMLRRSMSYSDIIEATGASSATVSRVKRSMQNAPGYALVFGDEKEASTP